MGYQYQLVSGAEREQVVIWLLLSDRLLKTGSYIIAWQNQQYRITHDQTYSGLPDPRIERILERGEDHESGHDLDLEFQRVGA